MWRRLTRGFQHGFNRRRCFHKPENSLKDEKASVHHQNVCGAELLPGAFQNVNRCIFKYLNDDQHKNNYDKNTKHISHHSFLEAFGWSGALVFGWAISKQLWLKQTLFRNEDLHRDNNRILSCKDFFVQLLTDIAKAQPPVNYVLPPTSTNRKPTNNTVQPTTEVIPTNNVHEQSNLDDEFELAAKTLKEIHDKAIAESLNRRGIAYLSRSRDSEAIKCFQRASELKYSPASFNMGQCCELGIGTKQDFKQAANWYKIASEQGHATAMYNLGVFYAHGWGGLRADIVTAKKFFVESAKLGQADAKAALDKESKSKTDLLHKANSAQVPFIKTGSAVNPPLLKSSDLNLFVNNIRSGLLDDAFQIKCGSENNWEVPLSSAVAF